MVGIRCIDTTTKLILSRAMRARSPGRRLTPSLLCAAALLVAPSAAAYERQWHAGASLGYSALFSNGAQHGFATSFDVGYGLRDWLDVAGSLGVSYHPAARALVTTADVGARFSFDVLRVVPHVGVLVGVADEARLGSGCAGGTSCNAARFDLMIPFGIDYQITRSFVIGGGGRFHLLLAQETPTPSIGALVWAQYAWGY